MDQKKLTKSQTKTSLQTVSREINILSARCPIIFIHSFTYRQTGHYTKKKPGDSASDFIRDT